VCVYKNASFCMQDMIENSMSFTPQFTLLCIGQILMSSLLDLGSVIVDNLRVPSKEVRKKTMEMRTDIEDKRSWY
jgi:hypothetical protein